MFEVLIIFLKAKHISRQVAVHGSVLRNTFQDESSLRLFLNFSTYRTTNW